MTKYGQSHWIHGFPSSRVPSYPRHRGHLDADVAIVGGGLTGCTTAYAFAAAGIKVVLLEAERIGRGSAGAAAGWVATDPGVPFAETESTVGLRAARHAWRAWRRAALDMTALVRRLELKCYLEPHPSVLVALTVEQAGRLRKEQKARRAAGLDAPALSAKAVAAETALSAAAAVKINDSATLDPYRATLGLAAAAHDRGAQLFERSAAVTVRFGSKSAEVKTDGGTVRVDRVIIATGQPTPLFKPLARHFHFKTTYLTVTEPVPAKTRHHLGTRSVVVRDFTVPGHLVRWVDDERLLVAGADSDQEGSRNRERLLVQRTGQLMYELSTMYPDISGLAPAFGWDADYARTADGLPYIGPHRNYPRHLFAFGDASQSVTGAYLASRILLRHYLGESDGADAVFGFTR